jgi:hypothetical protein
LDLAAERERLLPQLPAPVGAVVDRLAGIDPLLPMVRKELVERVRGMAKGRAG